VPGTVFLAVTVLDWGLLRFWAGPGKAWGQVKRASGPDCKGGAPVQTAYCSEAECALQGLVAAAQQGGDENGPGAVLPGGGTLSPAGRAPGLAGHNGQRRFGQCAGLEALKPVTHKSSRPV